MCYITIKINDFKFDNRQIFLNTEVNFNSTGIYYLQGANGSGKSTFLNILSSILKNKNISYLINDKKVSPSKYEAFKNKNIFYCLQNDIIFDNKTLIDNLFIPFLDKDIKKAEKILKKLELYELINSNASTLSNGEKARLSFARALYSDKSIIILDEITSSLDEYSKNIIENLIIKLSADHLIIYTSNEKVSDILINNSNILKINNLKINKEKEISLDSKLNSTNKTKKNKNIFKQIFSKSGGLYTLLGTSFTLFSTLMLIFASLTNASDTKYKEKIIFNEYLNITPSILISENTNINKFNKEDVFSINSHDYSYFFNTNNIDLRYDSIISPDLETSFEKHFKLISFKSGTESNYPKNESEVIISSLQYEKLIKTLSAKISNELDIDNYILNTETLTNFGKIQIVGVYEAIDDPKISKYIDELNKAPFKNMQVNASYTFKTNSLISFNRSNISNQLVVNSDNLKENISINDINKNILRNADSIDLSGDILTQNNKGENVFGKLLYGNKSHGIFLIVSICAVLFLLATNFYIYYTLNIRRLIFLRATTNSRNSLIKKELIKLISFNILTFGISILFTFIFTLIYTNIINNELMFFTVSNIVSLGTITLYYIIPIFIAISIFTVLLFVFTILLPKNFKKAFYTLNKKS